MPLKKLNQQKLIAWLSPVLLVSLGLHGLLLWLPLPAQEPPEEAEVELLPEPIQVTELPPAIADPDLPPAGPDALLTPEQVPAVAVPSAVPPASSPAAGPLRQQPVVEPNLPLQKSPEPEPVKPAPVKPNSVPPDPRSSDPSDPSDPTGSSPTGEVTGDERVGGGIQPQAFSTDGTTDGDYQRAGFAFLRKYGASNEVASLLDLGYPADGQCFDQGTDLEAVIAVSLNGSGGLDYGELLRKTTYPNVNAWLQTFIARDGLALLPDDVFADLQQIHPDAPSEGDLIDWLNAARDNRSDPLVPKGIDSQAYTFEVAITIEDNQCE